MMSIALINIPQLPPWLLMQIYTSTDIQTMPYFLLYIKKNNMLWIFSALFSNAPNLNGSKSNFFKQD